MQVLASLHYTDAVYGLAVGAVATGLAVAASAWRPRWSRALVLTIATLAGLVAMFAARTVRWGLVDEVATAAALSVVSIAVVAGIGWSLLGRYLSDRWLTVVVFASAGGVWAAVPDTETAISLMAAWLPFAVLVFTASSTRRLHHRIVFAIVLGWCGLSLVLAWAAAWGASARDASLPGALACFGIALVAAVPRLVARSTPAISLVVVHVLSVVAAARWAAHAATTAGGIGRGAMVIGACAVAVFMVAMVSGRRDEQAHQPPSVPVAHPR